MKPPFFHSKVKSSGIPGEWKHLKCAEQLAHLIDRSYTKPVGIFKHSTRCPRSSSALQKLIEESHVAGIDIEMHYLDLLQFRSISDAVASRLNIHHQSPQLIVLENGHVKYQASHEAISIKQAAEKINV